MKKISFKTLVPCLVVLFAVQFAGLTPLANAQAHVHPAYDQAISHLREAQDMLQATYQNPTHQQVAHTATQEIIAAIADLKQATAMDDKNPGAGAPGNTNIQPSVRFHKAYDLIKQAHAHASGPESDPMALHARESALKHMDAAMAALSRVMQT